MSKRGKRPARGESASLFKDGTRHGIIAIGCFAVAVFFILAAGGYAGRAGAFSYQMLYRLFGSGFFIIPLVLMFLAISFLRANRPNFVVARLGAGGVLFVAILAMISILFPNPDEYIAGGIIGSAIASPLKYLFATYSLFFLGSIILISLLIIFDTHLSLAWLNPLTWRKKHNTDTLEEIEPIVASREEEVPDTEEKEDDKREEEPAREVEPKIAVPVSGNEVLGKAINWSGRHPNIKYDPPPLSLLERDSGKPGAGDIKASANIIKRSLHNFGIVVEMDEVSIGPSITRYALKPAEGVKLSRIVALQNDLSLALAAHPIRIEAPIPGKSLVGIEIPNRSKSLVGLASLLGSADFGNSPHPLYLSLGRGISGQAHFANLAKAPHMLIAGTTGSGKSVVIHTFITSLLYRNPPDRLRFIMIDPKRVELTLYNKIPHLLTPVVTDAKKAIMVLKWAIKEMERRYNILEECAVRDIQSYHQNILETGKGGDDDPDQMPYIVIIIDELADIMSTYPRELEASIVRLAQMSRAVGIHLLLSTQRPSVEVITGLIKANIPARVAMQVASQIDSRTIIDMAGAEKLLGSGDMLYLSGDRGKPIRLQSAFISETEVKKVVSHLAKQYQEELNDQLVLDQGGNGESRNSGLGISDEDLDASDDDELYEEAREAVIKAGKASASYLQRKLKVGYARAARLLDMLEERGVIGPGEGAKQREVYEKDPNLENVY